MASARQKSVVTIAGEDVLVAVHGSPLDSELVSAGAQPGEGDCDEPADRGLGRQIAGCREGVQAIARELGRRDIISDVAAFCALGHQVPDEVAEVLPRSGDVLTSMQE